MSQDINCVADVSRQHGRERPDAQALWFEGVSTSYAELDRRSSQCAKALITAGVQPGDRVGTIAKGSSDFYVLWFGCLKARACLAPVNWRLAAPEVQFILGDAACKIAFVGRDYNAMIAGLDLPALKTVIQFEAGHETWPGFGDWIAAQPATDPMLAALPDDDVIQLYTSGTTGLPKGVQLTETNYAACFAGATQVWAQFDPQNAQAWFSLGNALVATREYAAAVSAYDTAMAHGETSDRLIVVRAGAIMGAALTGGRPLADAIAAFEAVRNTDPPMPTVFLSLGKLYDKSGRPAEAAAAFSRFLEVAPADHEQRGFAEGEVARLTPTTN